MPTPITTVLRDRTLKGIVTTSDLVPISRLLMTPDEQAIMLDPNNPDPILAGELIQTRLQAQLDALTSEHGGTEEAKDRANEIITQEWIKRLMVICESDLELRTLILVRLMEIFPDIPTEWMWFSPVTRLAGHRLEFDELLLSLILPVYAAIANTDSEGEIQKRMAKLGPQGVGIQALAGVTPAAATQPPTADPPAAAPPAAPEVLPAQDIDIEAMSGAERLKLLESLTALTNTENPQESSLLNDLRAK